VIVTEAQSEEVLEFAAPRTIAEIDLRSGASRAIIDGAEPFDAQAAVARFIIAGRGEIQALVEGLTLDSTADLSIPSIDVDSEEKYDVRIGFYIDEQLRVVITADNPVPRQIVMDLAFRIAGEVPDQAIDEMQDVGDDARWTVVRILRQRVRDVEESVRTALADEHISGEDYGALREYPVRLARVERLVSGLKEPTWESARQRDSFYVTPVDLLWKSLSDVASDARDAVARLSGLIASQSVVVAQRQAAETERFQQLLTLVGTTVLVPGVVAAVFGANVDFPGRDTVDGFWAMLLFMVASGAGSYAALRSFEQDLWTRAGRRLGLTRSAEASEARHLVAFVSIAVIATACGVVILICG
jgi:Mg2+ and Co2+ transporter CorA